MTDKGGSPQCAPNFRDVADLVPGLRSGQLYRSDFIAEPSEEDESILRRHRIRVVVDLRSEHESESWPNRWWMESGAEVVRVDVASRGDPSRIAEALQSSPGAQGAHRMMKEAYALFPHGAVPALRLLGERLEQGDLPALVHCTAGKDRTGFTVAALLLALDVPQEAVLADYLASHGRVNRRVAEQTRAIMDRAFDGAIDDEAYETINGVHEDFLRSALEAVERSHGSLGRYLHEAGLDDRRIGILKDRLLA